MKWNILFENDQGDVVDQLNFGNYRKAVEVFEALVLKDFYTAVLVREDGTFLNLKTR